MTIVSGPAISANVRRGVWGVVSSMAVRLKDDTLQSQGSDRWYVTDGLNAVGPVRLDLLVRGIEAGRVPLDSFVRHEGWKVWRPLAELAEPSPPDGRPAQPGSEMPLASLLDEQSFSEERAAETVQGLMDDDLDWEQSAGGSRPGQRAALDDASPVFVETGTHPAHGEVPTQQSRDLLGVNRPTLASYLDDDEETHVPAKKGSVPPRPVSVVRGASQRGASSAPSAAAASRPASQGSGPRAAGPSLPEDDLIGATDVAEGLLLLLNSIVRRTGAQVAVLHRMADDGASVVCVHGPHMVDFLGTRTRLLDPAVVAAAGGSVVIAEPAPGPAGDATMARLRKSGVDVEGALMFPIRPRGRLLGFVEVGKDERFEIREIMKADETVKAFVRKVESGSWKQ